MKHIKIVFKLVISSIISAILFFASAFLTWLLQVAPHIEDFTHSNRLEIGFPFPFYHQFCMESIKSILGYGYFLEFDYNCLFLEDQIFECWLISCF